MICTSVREGVECFFMSKKGCKFTGGTCYPVVEECGTCNRIVEFPTGKYCMIYPDPAAKWRIGTCDMATHIKAEEAEKAGKINPLKASKRMAR
ncbi:MAG: PxxKW family cysteine-rich protein [Deltaproteobacteria bacterium]|nr:PxxKW family cysteine-rich protein [Deltaproteobacteria bacterium]